MVHYNTKAEEPMTSPTGVVVLGVFFEIGKKEKANQEIQKIAQQLSLVANSGKIKFCRVYFISVYFYSKGQSATVKDISVFDLLPQNRQKILRYNGSLTTPPCAEVVDWIIFPNTVYITSEDVRTRYIYGFLISQYLAQLMIFLINNFSCFYSPNF